ncbi:Ser/Thr protein phosphatase superfamily [Paecilomyces variotii No. 5]|uniref:Ser/Thr protein phosphatase superfamily n=1 Tax=Byssochlamys spectabilis (strain No. 5 / NBRC 109023) TaxID=1356009 RepID=V5G1L3_BYSSN|nr:Ser/Thr protein phosphatase superfamily [Paecilomyces variotii No. 5]
MIRIQVLSDLHLEAPSAYGIFDIPPRAPYLALLGDIGNTNDDALFTFLEAQLRKFQVVFFLLGNHEPYHSNWASARDKTQKFAHEMNERNEARLGKFIFLDHTRYDISTEVTVLGCTLYSNVADAQKERVSFGLNDFYHIDDWSVEAHLEAHRGDLAWLNDQVAQITMVEPQRKIVVFTHHSPTVDARAVDPNHANSPISSGFVSDLAAEECWRSPSVCAWAFGHTHYNCDFVEEETRKRVIANQRGYYFSQAKAFEPERVIEV